MAIIMLTMCHSNFYIFNLKLRKKKLNIIKIIIFFFKKLIKLII